MGAGAGRQTLTGRPQPGVLPTLTYRPQPGVLPGCDAFSLSGALPIWQIPYFL